MRRLVSIILTLTLAVTAAGQNNPYSIDDECFTYYSEAERLVEDVDSDEFSTVNAKLLSTALAKGD